MIDVGERLPLDFVVGVVLDGAVTERSFATLLDRPRWVSAFLRAGTPSCDRQFASLGEAAPSLAKVGLGVLGLSRDRPSKLLKYAQGREVPFPLVGDPEDRFARAAETLVEKVLYGRRSVGPARIALLLDRDGTVLHRIEKVDPREHAAQLLSASRGR